MSNQEIKVSVCVVTYNHERYIAECLQSLVEQETNFNFEVIVSDDCSTDRTPEIIKDFQRRYSNIIKPILHEKNIGALKNFIFVHEQAVGKYIAHMDGDDYALPGKLQTQVDYLDSNLECNIVFHKMKILDTVGEFYEKKINDRILNKKFIQSEIVELIAIGANSSKMYRSSLRSKKLPDFDLVDYTVNVIHVGDGYAAYCGEQSLGVYRKGIGISGSESVNLSAYNSLNYFWIHYKHLRNEINSAAWIWFLNNLKYNKKTKWKFLMLICKTFSVRGLLKYFQNRNLRRELSDL